jgi:hypothetical protein
MVGSGHLRGICGSGEYLGHERVWIEGDRGHELLELLRGERLGQGLGLPIVGRRISLSILLVGRSLAWG